MEEGDRDKPASIGERRVASLVPIWVVFTADDVEEVAAGEAELLRSARCVVV